MTTRRDDVRSAALDEYLAQRVPDGYRIETRSAMQAVIVRRRLRYVAQRLARKNRAERRLVVSVDEHGEVSAVAAQRRRW